MKQINVCVGVKVSDCKKYCNRYCNFYSLGKCSLFSEGLKQAKVRDVGENEIYLRCEDCIDYEE
jgi:hypothetical protein